MQDITLTRIIQEIYKQGLYIIITEIIGAGELSKDCDKSLNIKEGVSYFPFDYTMCKFITDFFFYGCRPGVNERRREFISGIRNDTEKKMFELLCSFLGSLFVSYT